MRKVFVVMANDSVEAVFRKLHDAAALVESRKQEDQEQRVKYKGQVGYFRKSYWRYYEMELQ